MARGLRVDAPSMLHHVTVRGVDGCPIFEDDDDRREMARRFDRLIVEMGFGCWGWVFMGNHIHLLLQTGAVPLPRLMAQLGTGYALYFNRRHGRKGHLWQDRYWSRPVEEDVETVAAYIHANPVRAGLTTEKRLADYYWCGHAADAGARARFPFETRPSRAARSARRLETRQGIAARQTIEAVVSRVCARRGVPVEALRSSRRSGAVARARIEVARLAVEAAGHRAADVARALEVDDSSVSRWLSRSAKA